MTLPPLVGPADRIEWFRINTRPMRTFHVTWFAFFCCFFAWFGLAPLMPVIRKELHLTASQVGWSMIASVAITVLARLVVGVLCDRFGPRRTYAGLLILGALPVIGVAFAGGFVSFLVCRLLIGIIGASFVITQYHTSVMFGPNCVGTANATTAGWGNLGGGVTQLVMPLVFAFFVGVLGCSESLGWRLCMVIVGLACAAMGVAYYRLTQDSPVDSGPSRPRTRERRPKWAGLLRATTDYRVWLLFVLYAACFGIELTIKNIAALYFTDYFGLGMQAAGAAAAAYGLMNLFARTLGGYVSDRCQQKFGLSGRTRWLCLALLGEGVLLMAFSRATGLVPAILLLMLLGLFVQMSNGATFAVVPFINRRALGSVAGLVGAGGNVGAVAAGFLFQGSLAWPTALGMLGIAVAAVSGLALCVPIHPHAIPVRVRRRAALTMEAAAVA